MANVHKKWRNPFYVLLIPVGAVFCMTAFAYSWMAFGQVNAGREAAEAYTHHVLYDALGAYGMTALLVELVVLTVLTVGAIATDSWWTRQPADSSQKSGEA